MSVNWEELRSQFEEKISSADSLAVIEQVRIDLLSKKGQINALMIGVGAAFDYESGNIKRAPMWMQKSGLEWFFRFAQEPKRLFKRYFVDDMQIFPLVLKYKLGIAKS